MRNYEQNPAINVTNLWSQVNKAGENTLLNSEEQTQVFIRRLIAINGLITQL